VVVVVATLLGAGSGAISKMDDIAAALGTQ
jgi:hypothetical protein